MSTRKKLSVLLLAVLTVVASVFSACGKKEGPTSSVDPNANYTYNVALATSPNTWNPHTQETDVDSYILDYTAIGLYTFAFNADRTKYEIVPEMADGEPVDVTAEYAGKAKWGIPSDATSGYAFKISLNKAACWQDGTPINADTYLSSMERLLNPQAQNHRADSYYSGNLSLVNAKAYVYQGQDAYTNAIETYSDAAVLTADDFTSKNEVYVDFTREDYFFGGAPGEYYDNGYAELFLVDGVDIYEKYQEPTLVTNEIRDELNAVAANFGDARAEAFIEFCFTKQTYGEIDFSEVGLQKTGDFELTFILTKEISDFNLHYSLTDNFIVKEDLYDANLTEVEGALTSTYGTSVATYMSYGPYKLAEYQQDKVIVMEKNDKWYGYSDDKHEGQYMTTKIRAQIVTEYTTRLEMFMKGELDTIGLQKEEMATYRASDYFYLTPGDSTWLMLVCSDYDALKAREATLTNRDKTILSYKAFREALSLCSDRDNFAQTLYPQGSVGLGLYSSLIVYDPENAGIYRNTDQAKAAICEAYGVEYGSGKEYATLEEAYESVTGYDLEAAKEKFQEAYDAALAAGDIDGDDIVSIEYMESTDSETSRKWYNYIKTMIEDAVKGTSLEGRVEVTGRFDAGNDFATIFQSGQTDIVIAGWTGSSMDPYGLMEAYLSENYMYDQWWDVQAVDLTISIKSKDITLNLYEWYQVMMGETVDGYNFGESTADPEDRLLILAALETAILDEKNSIPLLYSGSASLASMKIKYGSEDYIIGIERGGVGYMTYNFTDEEWADYVSEQGGTLIYE